MLADELQEPLLDGDGCVQTSWEIHKLIFAILDRDANRNSRPDVAYFDGKKSDLIRFDSRDLVSADRRRGSGFAVWPDGLAWTFGGLYPFKLSWCLRSPRLGDKTC